MADEETAAEASAGEASQVAGKRPKFGDQDGPTVSRHKLAASWRSTRGAAS